MTTLLDRKAAKLVVVCKPMSNNVYYSYKSKENRNRQNRLILDQRVFSFDQPAIFSLWAASIWIANLPLYPPLAKCRQLVRSLPYCLRLCCTGWSIVKVFSVPHFPMVSSSIGVRAARPVLWKLVSKPSQLSIFLAKIMAAIFDFNHVISEQKIQNRTYQLDQFIICVSVDTYSVYADIITCWSFFPVIWIL